MHKRAPTIVAGLVLWGGVAACADIWGFEDGVLGTEAGPPDGKTRPEAGRRDTGTPRDSMADVRDSTLGKDAGADGHDGTIGTDSTVDVRDAATRTDSPADVRADTNSPCSLVCVPAAAGGWSGPYVISETTGGPPAPTPASCSGSYSVEAYAGLASPHATAATCTCKCGPAEGGSCAPPTVTLYNAPTCDASSECASVDASAGTCFTFDASCTGTYMELGTPQVLPGRCRATGTTNVPDAGWTASVRLCGPADASAAMCSVGKVCMPGVPDASFESTYCIFTTGSEPIACPPGPYSHQRVYYGDATDDRGCSACSCGAPDASCTGGTYTTHKKTGCGANSATFSAPQSCVSIGADRSGIYNGNAVVTSGACAPDGGVATGSFTPTTPTTICCTE